MEAADLVLLDKFDSIVEAIRLGRLVFQNLQKGIAYLLSAGSYSEIWPVILNVFFGVPLPCKSSINPYVGPWLTSISSILIPHDHHLRLHRALPLHGPSFRKGRVRSPDTPITKPQEGPLDQPQNLRPGYLFIGTMETISAHAMFFLYMWRAAGIPIHELFFIFEGYSEGFHGYTTEQLTHFNTVGQSVYFVTLVIMQWDNLLSIRNKGMSIFQADPFRKARRMLLTLARA